MGFARRLVYIFEDWRTHRFRLENNRNDKKYINHGRLPKDSRDMRDNDARIPSPVDELWLLSGSGSGPRGDFIEPWEDQQDCLWPLGQSVFSLGRPHTGKFDSDSEFERFLESQCLAGKSWSRLSDKLPPADEPLNQTSRSPRSEEEASIEMTEAAWRRSSRNFGRSPPQHQLFLVDKVVLTAVESKELTPS